MSNQNQIESHILSIEDVSIKFGDFNAIKNISTKIKKNEVRFFIGPNGAGKTTILDAICGKNKISSGKIIYQGEYEVSKMKEHKISELGIGRKFQAPSIFTGITIQENMELAATPNHSVRSAIFDKLSKENLDYINHILEEVGLLDKHSLYPTLLSHGEKQWLEIAMIMVTKPKLMLLDEPVAGMGRKETEKTAELLHKIKKESSVIVVEHDMKFAKDVSDSVTVFHEGQVLDEGTMDSVQSNEEVISVYLGRGGEK
jgi:urea transport system ATP-binding protein